MKHILIASRPRSGTHWLKSTIGSCPGVAAIEEEPFHDLYTGWSGFWDGKTEPESWLLEHASEGTESIVFCAHPKHLGHDPAILPVLQRIVTHVIVLYRRDLLAGFVSMQLAEANWEWPTVVGVPPAHGSVTVDLIELREWAAMVRDSLAADKEQWDGRLSYVLAYEDLVGDTAGCLNAIGQEIGVDTSRAVGATEKKERRPLSEVVTNYREARAVAAEVAIE